MQLTGQQMSLDLMEIELGEFRIRNEHLVMVNLEEEADRRSKELEFRKSMARQQAEFLGNGRS